VDHLFRYNKGRRQIIDTGWLFAKEFTSTSWVDKYRLIDRNHNLVSKRLLVRRVRSVKKQQEKWTKEEVTTYRSYISNRRNPSSQLRPTWYNRFLLHHYPSVSHPRTQIRSNNLRSESQTTSSRNRPSRTLCLDPVGRRDRCWTRSDRMNQRGRWSLRFVG